MLHESIQHQIGCKRFNKRLNSLVFVYVAVGLFTLVIGIVETVIFYQNKNDDLWPIWYFNLGGFSPVIILSIFFLTPSLLGHLIVHGYTRRVRTMLILFMVLTTFSLIAAFMLSMLSILSLIELPELITCESSDKLSIPIIRLKAALPIQRYQPEDLNSSVSSMKDTTKCTTGANVQIIIIAVIELVLSVSQLVTSIIGTIIVTQIKPWKKFKVRIRTTYDRFRSLKLSCGCGGETQIGKNDFNFKQSRVNHGFKDFPIQKVCSIDDDNFLNHLESCTPTRFQTPRHSPKNLNCETSAPKGAPTVL